ncbi:hypothetical protein BOX37_26740 [Nocardia mangyaensis]|uniref:Uncharacterized protein n=1 Tax=Nocardia mangyaensis TaxID=2213200 RepID=A0A1J0VYB8_9NOCA|nr:hypothetical protein [Nocardia mangyaensis]APE36935.1 hypothetical protein BOX37_26740 [Nocardia mangyaensis]
MVASGRGNSPPIIPNSMFSAREASAPCSSARVYPQARIRELAHAIVGDRTFADFAIGPKTTSLHPHLIDSSLFIPVYSAKHGNLLLPRDLPKLGLSDLPVADALAAATRIPGALPAAEGLDDIFE